MGVRAVALLTYVVAALLGAVALAVPIAEPPRSLHWTGLALAFMLAELKPLEFRTSRDVINVSLSDLPVAVSVLFIPLPQVWLGITVGILLAEVVRRRTVGIKLLFNVGLSLAAASVMALLVRIGLQGMAPEHLGGFLVILVAVVASSVMGHVWLQWIVHLAGTRPDRATRARAFGVAVLVAVGSASAAAVTVDLLWQGRGALVPLAVLAVIAVVCHRAYVDLRRSHESLRVLHRFTSASLHAMDRDDTTSTMLAGIRAELRCERVELLILDQHASVQMRMRIGPDGEELPPATDVGGDAAHRWAVEQAAGEARLLRRDDVPPALHELLADLDVEDAMVAPLPLSRRERLSGIVVAINQLGRASMFDADGLALLGAMVGHAAVALENGRLLRRLREEAEEREHAALHDALTGLPNRRLLTTRIEQALHDEPGVVLGVLLMDLDRFKDINDTLGHHVGDLLLQEVGRRIRDAVRPTDLVARLGGDEYAVLVTDVQDAAGVEVIARRIEDALALPCRVGEVNIALRGSVGIALSPEHGTDTSSLLRSADVAMYRAKARGGGHRLYSPADDHHTPRLLSLAADLRTALADRQVTVHFQPKICIRSGRVLGAEALARWTHPTEGFIPPDEFVGIAEDHGMIDELTTLVIQEALDQAGAWNLTGQPIGVAVNLSPKTVVDTTFPERLAGLLDLALVEASMLTLEVTESSMLSDPDTAVMVLNQIAELGVRISIDDFGTGFSSLSYLKRLPASEVKIDRAFVGTMTSDSSDEVIVRSVVDLGHNLGMQVVAEGVEDRATVDALAALGCDIAQGYAFSRPLPPADFMGGLRTGELLAQGRSLTQRTAA